MIFVKWVLDKAQSSAMAAGSFQKLQAKPTNPTLRSPHNSGNPQGAANAAKNGTIIIPSSMDVASGVKKNGVTTHGTENNNSTCHLLHDVDLSLDWSSAEQSSLEEGLVK